MGMFFEELKNFQKKALCPFLTSKSSLQINARALYRESGKDARFSWVLSRRKFLKGITLFSAASFAAARSEAANFKGVEYLSMSQLANSFGMQYRTLEEKKRQSVYTKNLGMEFQVHKRDISLAGRKIWLGFPIVEANGMLHVAKADVEKSLAPILFPSVKNNIVPLYNVVIDPGHGGKDNGATNQALNLYEKNVALDISNKLAAILRLRGYKVALTRTKDVYLPLQDRYELANKWKADMFISVHCNAASPSVYGIETFAITPSGQPSTNTAGVSPSDNKTFPGNANDPWNTLTAYYMQGAMVDATGSLDRGLKRARFAVLTGAAMPAVLIEAGFISNPAEARKLATNEYRQKIAVAIAGGVSRYQQTIDRLRGRQS